MLRVLVKFVYYSNSSFLRSSLTCDNRISKKQNILQVVSNRSKFKKELLFESCLPRLYTIDRRLSHQNITLASKRSPQGTPVIFATSFKSVQSPKTPCPTMSSTYQYTGEEGKHELRILASLIDQPDTTPEETVEQINKLTLAPKTYDRQLGDHCYFTAVALLSAAARTSPDRQAKLISFLHKLRSTTVNDPSSGEPLEHEDRIIWSGLPTFGYTFADELNSIPGMLMACIFMHLQSA